MAALWISPGSSVHGILQARILEWVPFPTPGSLPDPEIEPTSAPPALAGGLFTTIATWETTLLVRKKPNSDLGKVVL